MDSGCGGGKLEYHTVHMISVNMDRVAAGSRPVRFGSVQSQSQSSLTMHCARDGMYCSAEDSVLYLHNVHYIKCV